MWCAAILFWIRVALIKWIVLPALFLLVLPLAALYQCFLALRCMSVDARSVFQLETELFERACPRIFKHLREHHLHLRARGATHRVRAFDIASTQPTHLLLLHGTGSCAVGMAEVLEDLAPHFHLLLVDLPGFGPLDSTQPHTTAEDGLALVVDLLDGVLTHLVGDEPVYVVAHSWGGFLALRHAAAFPQRVRRLLLVSPAGLFPTLGVKGAYYAFVFKNSLTNHAREWGAAGRWLLRLVLDAAGATTDELFWAQVLASPSAWGDKLLAQCISVTWSTTCWTLPALNIVGDLVERGVPLLVVHGAQDTIMPAHQGDALRLLYRIPNERLDGVGHSPFAGDAAHDLARIIVDFSTLKATKRASTRFDLGELLRYRTPFDESRAAQVVSALYTHALAPHPVPDECFDDTVLV